MGNLSNIIQNFNSNNIPKLESHVKVTQYLTLLKYVSLYIKKKIHMFYFSLKWLQQKYRKTENRVLSALRILN